MLIFDFPTFSQTLFICEVFNTLSYCWALFKQELIEHLFGLFLLITHLLLFISKCFFQDVARRIDLQLNTIHGGLTATGINVFKISFK